MAIFKTANNEYEIVIGLEIHAQVKTKSKLFSVSNTEFGAEPNSQVSLVDAAMPGVLPVLNREAIRRAVKTGLAIKGKINLYSIFDRKNYFYADLPQGYQISQFSDPLVSGGEVVIKDENEKKKIIGITRIHVEQDAGKSIHDQHPSKSFIDLNRAGIALMEIVTEPDIRSSHEAAEFVKNLRNILRYIDSCDGDMEKGMLRCDANVSLRLVGAKEFGTRCEIKNLNSIRNIQLAIDYEVERQADILDNGGEIRQQTRLFNVASGETRVMRDKEDAHDYRYFPDPNLLPLHLSAEFVQEIAETLPELPEDKKQRYIKEFSLSEYDADVITADKAKAEYFEQILGKCETKLLVSWYTAELFGRLNKAELDIDNSPVKAESLLELILLIQKDVISGKIAKDVLDKMFASGKSAALIVKEEGLEQISDDSQIEAIIAKVLTDNPDKLAEYKSGKEKLFGFFIGQIMKETGGKANPGLVNQLLKKQLSS